MRRRALAWIAAALVSVLWATPPTPVPAAAAGTGVQAVEHRAAVVIDTGTEVKSVCVRFREESITGVEALARAQGVDPVFHGFAGKGAAVCALCGVGCPAGDSCLTCNAEGKFWSYSRAPAGTGTLRTSGVGASSTTIRDGDVEGWKWALGGAPPFQTVEQVCSEAPAPTTSAPATSATAVTTTAAGSVSTTPAQAGTPSTTRAPSRQGAPATRPATAPVPGATPAPVNATTPTSVPDATAAPTTAAPGPAPELAASRRPTHDRGGGSGPELALFAMVLAGLVVWGAGARRARARQQG